MNRKRLLIILCSSACSLVIVCSGVLWFIFGSSNLSPQRVQINSVRPTGSDKLNLSWVYGLDDSAYGVVDYKITNEDRSVFVFLRKALGRGYYSQIDIPIGDVDWVYVSGPPVYPNPQCPDDTYHKIVWSRFENLISVENMNTMKFEEAKKQIANFEKVLPWIEPGEVLIVLDIQPLQPFTYIGADRSRAHVREDTLQKRIEIYKGEPACGISTLYVPVSSKLIGKVKYISLEIAGVGQVVSTDADMESLTK